MNILYYSPTPSHPVTHGNRSRISVLARKFQELGHTVHFVLKSRSDTTNNDILTMKSYWDTFNVAPQRGFRYPRTRTTRFDGWYTNGLGEYIHDLCIQYNVDIVLCSYVYQSKLLDYVPNHILKIIDTHDKKSCTVIPKFKLSRSFICTPEEEKIYLQRADLVIGITEEESYYFETIAGHQNVITVSHIQEPNFSTRQFASLRQVGIVASKNAQNFSMIRQFLASVNRHVQEYGHCPFKINIAGRIKTKVIRHFMSPHMRMFKKPWVQMHGFIPDITQFYDQMDIIVSPMMVGTGINIKTVEAMAHGMPILTTRHGSRGIATIDGMHQHDNIDQLVNSLFTLNQKPGELERLAALSRERYQQFHKKNMDGLNAIFNQAKVQHTCTQ